MSLILAPYRFGGGQGDWTPASISPYAWYISDDPANTYASNDYATLADRSGNGRTATALGTTKPTKNPGGISGRQTIRFDAVTEAFSMANSQGVFQNKVGATVYAVYQMDPDDVIAASRNLFFAETNASTFTRVGLCCCDGSVANRPRLVGRRADGDGAAVVTASGAVTAPAILGGIIEFQNSDAYLRLNGSLDASSTSFLADGATANTASFAAPRIGNSTVGSEQLMGELAEIIIFDRAITAEERVRVEGYLAWRWGLTANLPANHPYKSAGPRNTIPGDPYWANVSLLLALDGANGSTSFPDSSPNALAVAAFGNAQISTAQSRFGGASLFVDGSGDYLLTPGHAVMTFGTGNFTVEGWARRTGSGSFIIFDSRSAGQVTDGFVVYFRTTTGTKLAFGTGNPFVATEGTTEVAADTWYHVAIERFDGVVRCYLNGALELTVANSANLSNTAMRFGASVDGSASAAGYIDMVRVTKGIVRYAGPFTPPAAAFPNSLPVLADDPFFSSVVLQLPFDGANGSTVFTDVSSYGHSPVANGNVTNSTVQKKFGPASMMSFDGAGDFLSLAHAVMAMESGDFTIEGWIYRSSQIPNAQFFVFDSRDVPLTTAGFAFFIRATNVLTFGTGNPFVATTGPTALADNTWYHVALTRAGGTVRGFLNGAREFAVANSSNFSNAAMRIGADVSGGAEASGFRDMFRITKGVARYTGNFPVPAAAFPNA